ncbi:hypothetical protein [Pseudochrobactrum sp. MP213Fo]|uniref:hypothetical protein n=1 Tax=Pseudochrobactrum sp. MP213Fo TaxID=3022250 RepID=UPI003BA0D9D0
MEGHNFEKLSKHILSMSVAQNFNAARSEWDLIYVEISEELDHCPCGQTILEHCYITNRLTNQNTYVGNVCINRFLGIDTGNLFEGLKRIRDDNSSNANEAVIEYAQNRGYLYEKEYQFLHNTRLKRKLSEAQLLWKIKINRRILNNTVVSRRTAR